MAEWTDPVVITFGGGINSRRRVSDIDLNECTDGENFDLDPLFLSLQARKPFDKVATATNAGSIDGFAQLVDQSGTTSTLIQAGTDVYEWNLASTFTSRGTVAAGTKLRGWRDHNFTSSQIVIITDINKNEVVKTWDGATFSTLAHNLGGSFYAKYCRVYRERAFYANVTSGTSTPHLMLGSKIGDYTNLTVTNRPTSSIGFDAAFYLPIPDLRPINGLAQAFGEFILSTAKGRLHRLKGVNSFNFDLEEFHSGSGASGDEGVMEIGNDVLLGLPGRIETLSGIVSYGDVEVDDASLLIWPNVKTVEKWRIVYDQLSQRVYCFPDSKSLVWVLHKSLIGGAVSPWSKWTTGHAVDFQPTTVWSMLDSAGLPAVYMGDGSGNIYKFDGTGTKDGGTGGVTISRTSRLFTLPPANVFDVEGWINYRKRVAATVTLTFLFSGTTIFDEPVTIYLPATTSGAAYYGGGYFYSTPGTVYGSSFTGRISRQAFGPVSGHDSFVQVQIDVSASGPVEIEELGLRFRVAEG